MVLAGYGRPEPHTKRSSSQGEAEEDSQRLLFFKLVRSLSGGKLTPKEQAGVQRLAQALLCREAGQGTAS